MSTGIPVAWWFGAGSNGSGSKRKLLSTKAARWLRQPKTLKLRPRKLLTIPNQVSHQSIVSKTENVLKTTSKTSAILQTHLSKRPIKQDEESESCVSTVEYSDGHSDEHSD